MERIGIVGGGGFIGSHIVKRLVEWGKDVYVLDCRKAPSLNVSGAQYYQGDVVNQETVRDFTRKVDVIMHLATLCLVEGLRDPMPMYQVNDVGTFNICLAAKQFGVKIVFIGSSEEYGMQTKFPISETNPLNPVSIYGLTKGVADAYVRFFNKIYDVPAVVIRPFNTFGPLQREDVYAGVITSFIKRVEHDLPPIINGDGIQTRDFTYITDIVDGILLLSDLENGEVINLGSGREVSVLELAHLISDVWDGKQREPIFADARVKDLPRLQADISLARKYGYAPKVSLKDGLKAYIEWYKNTEML